MFTRVRNHHSQSSAELFLNPAECPLTPKSPVQIWRERTINQAMDAQIARVEASLEGVAENPSPSSPVLFFNASTRIHRLSLNGAYSLLASWALRADGIPVKYVVCEQGMEQCILGFHRNKPAARPPCKQCIMVSRRLFPSGLTLPVHRDDARRTPIELELATLPLERLVEWEWDGLPLGRLVLPGLRWVMRRHNLEDDAPTRLLYRKYVCSGVSLARAFSRILRDQEPSAVVVFNGIFFPEALLRYQAQSSGIRVITHEVGLQPFSAFFSHQEATFREVELGEGEKLSEQESQRLDRYLEDRFQGDFSMAGIRFWDKMEDIPPDIGNRLSEFSAIVSIFSNVVFDTSQIHANTIFPDMFDWLEGLRGVIQSHPETLFILRAHPDENRPGKTSAESVSDWIEQTGLAGKHNLLFIGPDEQVNSYRLIEQSKLVLVYNSSIGLEASILGKPVLCAGRARYTQAQTVTFPETREMYMESLEEMLAVDPSSQPAEYMRNARKFLHDELFRASLDLSAFLEVDRTLAGMVTFKDFDPVELRRSESLVVIKRGILEGTSFLLDA